MKNYTQEDINKMSPEQITDLLNAYEGAVESLNASIDSLKKIKEDWQRWFKELEEEHEKLLASYKLIKDTVNNTTI